ncbi:D-amino acid dehydrogenase [Snodgrassella alvi]|uniref:D-amino acid dehydrogenase n=1 Tax=Snodgrassella alvi TaxID=1196083 RepID=UPI0024333223|nr:D-amino acid dehydrogenase [Snodgrassella alvi]WLT02142.1 D-amino acid dehydrogenase [Snodgrassella alvi]
MKVLIMGAGIVGVSTAWYLAKAGHEVTVLERADQAAMETSFANAGQLSYGYTTPWAAPNIPAKAWKWLFKEHSPLLFRPDGSLFQLQWLWQMYRNCNARSYATNKERMVRISEYSRAMLQQLQAEENIQFEGRSKGTLQIFRTEKEVIDSRSDVAVLQEFGVPLQELSSVAECVHYEPALAHMTGKLAGALYLPQDGTGDCHLFTTELARKCEDLGVKFLYRHAITEIQQDKCSIKGVMANGQYFTADHYVCALGCFSRSMLSGLGINLPVYPVKGYSLTIPITDEAKAPVSTVIDETYKVAVTRFDKRIRAGGMAELSGYRIHLNPKRKATLDLVVNDLFPDSCRTSEAFFWSGLRPMTPDSTPIIGASRFVNLSINTGHGTLGWTMGLGSGRILADLISGVKPEIETSDLSLARYV